MDIREYRDKFFWGTTKYDLSKMKHRPERALFDIAMHTIRESRDEYNVAWVAAMNLRNPELLTELALGASEFVVSEWAISSRLDDEHLIRIIQEIEDNDEKWVSPLDVEPDNAWGHRFIKKMAARTLRDKELLIDIALEEGNRSLKAYYICRIAEQPDALRSYVEREPSIEALMVAAASTDDVRMLEHVLGKLDARLAESGTTPPTLTFKKTTFDIAALKNHLLKARQAMKSWPRYPLSEQAQLRNAQRMEEVWVRWDAASEEDRSRADMRHFEFYGEDCGHGWERAKITIDGETHYCRISDIGDSLTDFVRFVDNLEDGSCGYFSWDAEGWICRWFIARRDPYVYVEAPDFENGTYLLTDTFRKETLKTVYRIQPLLNWY